MRPNFCKQILGLLRVLEDRSNERLSMVSQRSGDEWRRTLRNIRTMANSGIMTD